MIDVDSILTKYSQTRSVRGTAQALGLSCQTVRRMLLDAGIDCSPVAKEVRLRAAEGETPEMIADALHIKVKTVRAYMPFTRGSYTVGDKTDNAQHIAAWRDGKRRRANGKQG